MKALHFVIFLISTCSYSQSWQWVNTYDLSEDCGESAITIGLDKWGNIYIKGTTVCASGGPNSSYQESNLILKYDNSGNLISTMPIVNGSWRTAVDPNGNMYVSANNFVKKYDFNGQLIWSKTIQDRNFSSIDANETSVVLSGNTGYPNCTDSSLYCMLDGNGNELWHRKGDFTPNCGDFRVKIASDNMVYSVSMTQVNGQWLHYLIIMDSLGVLVDKFQLTAFNTPNYYDCKIDILSDKTILVSGLEAYSPPTLTTTIARYSPQGNLLWSDQLTATYGNIANMKLDKNDNIYIAGYATGTVQYQSNNISAGKNMFLFKLNPSGNVLWEKHTTGIDGGVSPYDFILDSAYNMYICGVFSQLHNFDNISVAGDNAGDMFIAKLSQPAIVTSLEDEKTITELFSLSPNPSGGLFNIACPDLKDCTVQLRVINTLGETLYREEQKHKGGQYSRVFDLSSLPKGIYFVEVNSGEQRIMKKIVLE